MNATRMVMVVLGIMVGGCIIEPLPIGDGGVNRDALCIPDGYPARSNEDCCSRFMAMNGRCATLPSPDAPPAWDSSTDIGMCGVLSSPCCTDANGFQFCLDRALTCIAGICRVPPPDLMAPPPDMTWRPDLTGGACVKHCGRCVVNLDCCRESLPGMGPDNCHDGICQPGPNVCPPVRD